MNEGEEDRSDAPDAEGRQDSGSTESGTARARRVLILPLSGLARPRRVTEVQHRDNLDRLARKLSYMDEPALRGLAELCLAHAGQIALSKGVATPVCPVDGMVLAWAYALQAPPIGQSDYPASVLRSAMGRRAHDSGYGVELLRMARRYGPPPGAYSLSKLKEEAEDNRRRRNVLRQAIETGSPLTRDQHRWLDAWHRDAEAVEQLIAEGDERRDAKGEAA